MFCSECGKELKTDAKFCHNCGKHINSSAKQLICQNCGGTMNFDKNQNVSFCPYCGSKEIIMESDYVKVQQIKNQRIENVEYNKNRSKIELKKKELDYKLEKKKLEYRNDMIIGFSGFAILFLVFFVCIILSKVY